MSLSETRPILFDIVELALVRVSELKQDRLTWIDMPVAEIQSKLESFFKVMEKVSHQRFLVVYPPETPGPNNFL